MASKQVGRQDLLYLAMDRSGGAGKIVALILSPKTLAFLIFIY